LRWYASRIHELTSIQVRVDIEGDEPTLDDAVKITIFRIVQEALNNVIKHSKATNVNVHLDYRDKKAIIFIRDNGQGFNMNAVQSRIGRVSLGLAGMEERAMLLGGTLEVHSRPDYGTQVDAEIPYQVEKVEGIENASSVIGG
jgi:signal transduction histidine kinase